jgi:hypothetical protein
MSWKDFQPGDFVEAADVQQFLMNQQVMIFSSASARNSAIGTAATEGMVTYVGGGVFEFFDGTSWGRWP